MGLIMVVRQVSANAAASIPEVPAGTALRAGMESVDFCKNFQWTL